MQSFEKLDFTLNLPKTPTGLGGTFSVYTNTSLTSIIFPSGAYSSPPASVITCNGCGAQARHNSRCEYCQQLT